MLCNFVSTILYKDFIQTYSIIVFTSNQFLERKSALVMIEKMAEGIFPSVNRIIINVNVKMVLFSLVECSLSLLILLLILFDVFVMKMGGFFFLETVPNLSMSSSLMVGLN